MTAASLDDCRWLTGDDGARWLTRVAADLAGAPPTPAMVRLLRTSLGPARTSLVLEQVELRARAREKFLHADELFFTRCGLEQATDEALAAYKAHRFADYWNVTDLCCGIGGDAMALAADHELALVDRDEIALLFAAKNVERRTSQSPRCTAEGVHIQHVAEVDAWHIDPDRRSAGQRTSHIEYGDPGADILKALLHTCPNAAIKLAPAADVWDQWQHDSEREWIETRGECRQQVAWFGSLAEAPGKHTATLIDFHGEACSVSGEPHLPLERSDKLCAYLFDPAPSVIAASLVGCLAQALELHNVSSQGLYLTGDTPVLHPLLQAFVIEAQLPLDIRQLRGYLQSHGVGRVEIKKRGVDVTPEQLRPQLRLQGDEEATLVLTRLQEGVRALICRRVVA
jgi:hypothetical protein